MPDMIGDEWGDLFIILCNFLAQFRLCYRVRIGRVTEFGVKETLENILLFDLVRDRICHFLAWHLTIEQTSVYPPKTRVSLRYFVHAGQVDHLTVLGSHGSSSWMTA